MDYDVSVMQTTSSQSMAEFSSRADLRRLQDVAGNYSQLQGLRIIPFGLFFLANALYGEQMMEGPVFIATFMAALILFAWIGLYYKRTFGRVRRRLRHHVRDGLAVAFFLIAIFLGVWAEIRFGLPISTFWLTFSGLFLYLYFCSGGRRRHYLAVAAGGALLSLLPALGLVTPEDFFGPGKFLGNLALGGTYILVGIIDHLYLVRSFKPVPVESDADTL